jgi:hypothetical protein
MSGKNNPLHSDALDAVLKSRLAEEGVVFADVPHALRDYAVAGAVFNAAGELYGADEYTIRNSAKQLSDAGIPLHPDTKFFFYNLLAPVRCDFLEVLDDWNDEIAYPASDVLLVCGIWGGRAGREGNDFHSLHSEQKKPYRDFREMYLDYSAGFRNDRLVTISRYQRGDDAWPAAAAKIGAKIVVTRGPDGIDAINSYDFEQPPYRTLVDTREKFAAEHSTIGGGLGILAHGGYLESKGESLRAAFNKNSLLGERLEKVLRGASFERPKPPPRPSLEDLLRRHGLKL